MKQLIKTANYNFTEKDLSDRLNTILNASNDAIKKKLSGVEYISFIERQLKEIRFINHINESKRLNISEVEIDG